MEVVLEEVEADDFSVVPVIRFRLKYTNPHHQRMRILQTRVRVRTESPMKVIDLGTILAAHTPDVDPTGTGVADYYLKLDHSGVNALDEAMRKTVDVWLRMEGEVLSYLVASSGREAGGETEQGTFNKQTFVVCQPPYTDKIRIPESDWLRMYTKWGKIARSITIYDRELAEKMDRLKMELKATDDTELMAKIIARMEAQSLAEKGEVKYEFVDTTPEKKSLKARISEMLEKAQPDEPIMMTGYFGTTFQEKFFELIRKGYNIRLITRKELDKECRTATDYLSSKNPDSVKKLGTLHARILVLGDREAIVSSADLKSDSMDTNFEAGIWTNNPAIVNDVKLFFEKMWKEAK